MVSYFYDKLHIFHVGFSSACPANRISVLLASYHLSDFVHHLIHQCLHATANSINTWTIFLNKPDLQLQHLQSVRINWSDTYFSDRNFTSVCAREDGPFIVSLCK